MALYAGEIARHELDLTSQDLAITNLPVAFHGFRIVQVSDIHLDEYTEPYFLEQVVHHINALAPDAVLLTGDFVTRGSLTFVAARHAAHRCAEILGGLKCTTRYAVLGNHDVTVGSAMVTRALVAHAVPVLVNQYTALERGGDKLWICGTDDPGAGRPNLDLSLPQNPGAPIILMAHAPDYADTVLKHPRASAVDLILSGHSHGGQVRLPLAGPIILPPMGRKYVEGHFQFGHTQLYVNRGIGTVGLPFRLNCPPEISVHTLRSAL